MRLLLARITHSDMKAILEFNLPDEEQEFKEALNGGMFKYVLWRLDQDLRGKIKYEQLNDCEHKCYSDIRELLHQILSQNNLDIE
jgi:hypothetical protein